MIGGLLILMLVALALLLAGLSLATYHRLTHPPRQTVGGAIARGLATDPLEAGAPFFETRTITGADGAAIEVWLADGLDPGGPIVVILHGWADGKIGALVWMQRVLGRVSRAVLFDQRGHGESRQRVCTFGPKEAEDAAAVVRWARTLEPARPVVLLGYSMGAAVALAAAAQLGGEAAGVIADSPYRRPVDAVAGVLRLMGLPAWPAARVAVWGLELRWPALRGLDAVEVASRLRQPVLVLHGSEDRITPADAAKAIAEAAPRGNWCEIPGADHVQPAAVAPERCDTAVARLFRAAAEVTG